MPVSVPAHSGASDAEKSVAIVVSTTKEMAQYWPAGGDCAVPEMITHPASPKDCLSILLVIRIYYTDRTEKSIELAPKHIGRKTFVSRSRNTYLVARFIKNGPFRAPVDELLASVWNRD